MTIIRGIHSSGSRPGPTEMSYQEDKMWLPELRNKEYVPRNLLGGQYLSQKWKLMEAG